MPDDESQQEAGRSVIVLAGHPWSLLIFRRALLRALVERGDKVTAVAPNADQDTIAALSQMGVAYRHVPLRRAAIDPWGDLRTFVALYRLFRESRPDLLLGYTIKPVIWGSLAARLAGIPQICSMITGLGFAFGEGGGWRRGVVNIAASTLYRLALRGNSLVVFQNPDDLALFQAQGLLRRTTRAVVVNGSGVDLDEMRQAPPAAAPHFLMAARLIEAKGVRDYVEASRILRRRHPAARFRLAGDLDEAPGAIGRAEVASWEAAGDIDYLGWLTDVRGALAACAVYVLPSFYREGTPRSVLEAMAMGRPIVTTDMPGCRETVVEGVNGFLVPPRDPAALAEALARFVEDPTLIERMGAASRRLAETRYDVHAVNRAILDALEQ